MHSSERHLLEPCLGLERSSVARLLVLDTCLVVPRLDCITVDTYSVNASCEHVATGACITGLREGEEGRSEALLQTWTPRVLTCILLFADLERPLHCCNALRLSLQTLSCSFFVGYAVGGAVRRLLRARREEVCTTKQKERKAVKKQTTETWTCFDVWSFSH